MSLSASGRERDYCCRGQRLYRAYIPELGLTNKATDLMNKAEQEERSMRHVEEGGKQCRLLEGQLADQTVWPGTASLLSSAANHMGVIEIKKLYGHAYDIAVLALARGPSPNRLLSGCKARDTKHAALLLWDTATYVSFSLSSLFA